MVSIWSARLGSLVAAAKQLPASASSGEFNAAIIGAHETANFTFESSRARNGRQGEPAILAGNHDT